MATNFKALLALPTDSIEKPKPAPVGNYSGVVKSFEFGESTKQKTPYCRVHLQGIAPQADVDQDAFSAFGGSAALGKKAFNVDFYLTEDALYRFKEFFSDVLRMNVSGKTLEELCPQMNGQGLNFEIVHTMSQDGTQIYANVGKLTPA